MTLEGLLSTAILIQSRKKHSMFDVVPHNGWREKSVSRAEPLEVERHPLGVSIARQSGDPVGLSCIIYDAASTISKSGRCPGTAEWAGVNGHDHVVERVGGQGIRSGAQLEYPGGRFIYSVLGDDVPSCRKHVDDGIARRVADGIGLDGSTSGSIHVDTVTHCAHYVSSDLGAISGGRQVDPVGPNTAGYRVL